MSKAKDSLDLLAYAKSCGITKGQIARFLHIDPGKFSRQLGRPMTDKQRNAIINAIESLNGRM